MMKIAVTHTITTDAGETVPAIAYDTWRQSVERREANRRSCRRGDEWNTECKMCGRKMSRKASENAHHVHMTVDLDLVPMNADVEDISQGWFAVGSECVKMLPAGFAKKLGVR
jgi:hypothetical protein